MDTFDDGPLELTQEALAKEVASHMREMSILAANRWSKVTLARHGREFIANTVNLLAAYERQAPNSFVYLAQAMALRIAILHRHTGEVVEVFGRQWQPPASWRASLPPPTPLRPVPSMPDMTTPAAVESLLSAQ